jgi:hypothetical protein
MERGERGRHVRVGRIDARPVAVPHGELQVRAVGVSFHLAGVRLLWLTPTRVTLVRADRTETAPVPDGGGRMVRILALSGVLVALASLGITRKWASS